MERSYAAPNILRLTGITPQDYRAVEDLLDEKLLDGVVTEGRDPVADDEALDIPDAIPKVFITLAEWPTKTNLRCWDSDFNFDDRPKFVPTYVMTNEAGELEIGVKGNFMTFNNAATWIRGNILSPEQQWKTLDMLCLVYKLFTGSTILDIESAPDKTKMSKYGGGDWDEETYLRELRALDPVNGLKDHTPGCVRAERERYQEAKKTKETALKGGNPHSEKSRASSPPARENPKAMWQVRAR